MKIIELSIVGSKRLLTKGTREIHWTPKSDVQILLGSNGYGKSSVLDEFSPLPAIQGQYVKGGSKRVVIEHNHRTYTLVSDYGKSHSHSFVIDGGDNINTGGTITIQKKLVEEHFGYTQEIHDLLLGNVRLTELGPQKRKEWMVKLCDVDVSFAVKVFSGLQQQRRNVQGALVHAEKKYLSEIGKQLDDETLANVQMQIDKATSDIRMLLERKNHDVRFTDTDRQELRMIEDRLRDISTEVLDKPYVDLEDCKSLDELHRLQSDVKSELDTVLEKRASALREYESIEEMIRLVTENDEVSIDDLKRDQKNIELAISEISATDINDLADRDDLVSVHSDLLTIVDQLDELFVHFPKNPDFKYYSNETVTQKKKELSELQERIDRLLFQKNRAINRVDELEAHKPTECPNCEHVWIPGVSEGEIERHKKNIELAVEKLTSLEQEKEGLVDWLEGFNVWKDKYLEFRNYVSYYPRLKFYWNFVVDDLRLYNRPESLVGSARRYLERVKRALELSKLNERLSLINEALKRRAALEGRSSQVLQQRMELISKQIAGYTETIETIERRLDELSRKNREVSYFITKNQEIVRLLDQYTKLMVAYDKSQKNALIDKIVDEQQQILATQTRSFNDAKAVEQIVQHLEQSINELKASQDDYDALLKALSPTDGLIADTLMGFIHNFTEMMNSVVRAIWTTPMTIRPCSTSDGDLDYRFPLTYGDDGAHPVPDVNCGSKGEKELIDFAFRLISMIYLKFENYPLLLDEVGHSFTEVHRRRLFDYIKLLVDSSRTSQIIVVSHFTATHEALTRADINIIDPTGLLITPEANAYFKVI